MNQAPRDRYYSELAAAFVGGVRPDLKAKGARQRVALGLQQGLDLHYFKRSEPLLPRVQRVLGMLKGISPGSLLDVGSGRGAFLWPLLNELPALKVLAIDTGAHRLKVIQAVRRGGQERLSALAMDVTRLALRPRAVEVVTILEVLEHLQRPEQAVREVVGAAERFVIASVPSRPDDNPRHINLLSADRLERMFLAAGARRVELSHVLNHLLALVRV